MTGITKYFTGLIGFFVFGFSTHTAAQEVTLRHALDGKAQDALASLVLRFNDNLKGQQARVVLRDARNLDQKSPLPVLALLDEDDSASFFATRPPYLPLSKLMQDSGLPLDPGIFYPQMLDAVADRAGHPQALPMGMSLPVLLINRKLVPSAAKSFDSSPRTWYDVQTLAGTLADSGVKCPLTSSRFNWVHFENTSAQHGESMITQLGRLEKTKANGLMNVKHLALLASWEKSRYFTYFGPNTEANQRFLRGECAMITGESSLYTLARDAGMDVTLAPLPYYEDVYGAQRDRVLPDGAALWAFPGHPKATTILAARFVNFLLQPENQKDWVRASGSLPMTPQGLQALRDAGIPPALADAADRRLSTPATNNSRPRVGALRDRLHLALNEQVALVWSTPLSAKQALDTATLQANSSPPGGAKKPAVAKKTKRHK